MSDRLRNNFYHQMHVNINRRNQRLGGVGSGKWEHWTYEAKNAMDELRRLALLFKMERENKLPQTFTYCSRSETERLPVKNELMCCLGVKTSECEYLRDLFLDMEQFPPEMVDSAKAHVCVVHVLHRLGSNEAFDTSEGYIQDETSRQFWQKTYEGMMAPNPDDEMEADI